MFDSELTFVYKKCKIVFACYLEFTSHSEFVSVVVTLLLQVNKMHAQTSHITYSLLLLRFCFYTIYFIDTHHTILSDSLRIVLHYYIQYEVRFSLSYLKKKSISPLISRFFPFSCHILLISFYIVCLISYRKYVWCYHH